MYPCDTAWTRCVHAGRKGDATAEVVTQLYTQWECTYERPDLVGHIAFGCLCYRHVVRFVEVWRRARRELNVSG
jgi:hypothetical protein